MTPVLRATVRSTLAFASALVLLAVFTLSPPASLRPALAQEPPSANVAKVVAWLVGGQLSLASLVYFRNTGDYAQFFNEAKSRAKEIGIDVKDFPPRPAKSTDGLIAMLDYFNKGDGARIRLEVERKYGSYHATLYDVSSHLFHIPIIYDLDPAMARDTLVAGMRTKLTGISLPDRLWKPVVDAVAAQKSFNDVRAAVVQMNQDVLQYLVKVARGEAQ